MRRPPDGRGAHGRGEVLDVHAEGDLDRPAPEALAPDDAAGGGVADRHAGGVAEGPALQPAKRRRVPLVDVLGGIEQERLVAAAQEAQEKDLGGGQAAGLLADVEHVPRPAEEPPEGTGVEDEQARMPPEGPHPGDESVAADVEVDRSTALVPHRRGRQAGHRPPGG